MWSACGEVIPIDRSAVAQSVAKPKSCSQRRSRSGKVRHLRRHPRMDRGCLARVVDHMTDFAVITQRHGNHVVEAYTRALRCLDCPGEHYIRINEDAVNAQPPRLMTGHSIRNLV